MNQQSYEPELQLHPLDAAELIGVEGGKNHTNGCIARDPVQPIRDFLKSQSPPNVIK